MLISHLLTFFPDHVEQKRIIITFLPSYYFHYSLCCCNIMHYLQYFLPLPQSNMGQENKDFMLYFTATKPLHPIINRFTTSYGTFLHVNVIPVQN